MSAKYNGWVHSFTVTDSITHKKGYTIYKITSIVFPRSLPQALSCLTVWKRFHEIKKLYREITKKHKGLKLKGSVPEARDFSYFKRFDQEVIDSRRTYIIQLMDFIAQHPVLYKSEPFVQFYENGQSPGVSPAHVAVYESYQDNIDRDDEEDDEEIIVETIIKEVADKVVQETSSSATVRTIEERKNDYLKMLTPMASFETEDTDYIYEAALEFSRAVQAEVIAEYQEAYEKYKAGVEKLLDGTKGDFNEERKAIAKIKITKYLARSDDIKNRFLQNGANENKLKFQLSLDETDGCADSNLYLERPWNQLSKYKVLRLLDRCMLVQSVVDKGLYVMKGIEKPSSHSPAQSVFLPQNIPYMVDLAAFYQSDEKIFILLRYAQGGKLFDYIRNYQPHKDLKRSTSINHLFKEIDSEKSDEPSKEMDADEIVTCAQKLLKSVSLTLDSIKVTNGGVKEEPCKPYVFPENCVKQWSREIITAIESLHLKGVILRDLHRDNLLIGADGQVLLSYFYQHEGLESALPDQISRKASDEYFVAPEIPLTMKSDWWSFGVILYELLTGYAFSSVHKGSIYEYNVVLYPQDCGQVVSEEAKDLLEGLLQKQVEARYDLKQIKSHKFFLQT